MEVSQVIERLKKRLDELELQAYRTLKTSGKPGERSRAHAMIDAVRQLFEEIKAAESNPTPMPAP